MYVSTHQKDWDRHIPMILFAYWVSPNATTKESPGLYGREPRLPIDAALLIPDKNLSNSVAELCARIVGNLEEAQKIISSNTQLAQQRMKEQYDKTAAPVQYDVGSKVWVFIPKKPKGLSKKLSHFKLHTMENRPVSIPVHANRLKPYFDPNDRPLAAPTVDLSTPDLSDTDLPADSFPADANSAHKPHNPLR